MKIGTRLAIGFGSLAFCLLFLAAFSIHSISSVRESVSAVTKEHYPKVDAAHAIENHVNAMAKSMRNYVLTESPEVKSEELERMDASRRLAVEQFTRLKSLATDPAFALAVADVERTGSAYEAFRAQVMELAQAGRSYEAALLLTEEGRQHQEALFQAVDQLSAMSRNAMLQADASADSVYRSTYRTMLFVPAVILALGAMIVLWFSRTIVRNVRAVATAMDGFVADGMEGTARVRRIPSDEIGVLGTAFNRMADALAAQKEQERRWLRRNEEQLWLHSNLDRLNVAMQGEENAAALSALLLRELTSLYGVSCGALYVSGEDGDRMTLAGVSGVGTDEGRPLKPYVDGADGVAGRALATGKLEKLEDVPASALRLSTTLTDREPAAVYLVPFRSAQRTEALLELAVSKELNKVELELLERLSDRAGLLFNKIKNQNRIVTLLRESQQLTEELQQYTEELNAQHEELAQANAELEEQTAALQDSERMLQAQQSQLEEMNAELEEKANESETAKRQLEQRARELFTASSYKSEFLANMSHELRTPLNSMLILTKLLAENKDGNLTDKQTEFAQTIYSAGNDLLSLINQILDLSRVESGKIQVVDEPISTDKLIDFVQKNYGPMAAQRGLELVAYMEPDVPPAIRSDSLRLHQILRNLLSNAFKFTEQGKIIFSVRKTEKRTGPALEIAVTDTGIGIPPDKQQAVFDAFVQADGTTSRKYGGTGLGLSISRELARLLGGSIQLESAPGRGSTFTLQLPLVPAKPEELEQGDHLLVFPKKPIEIAAAPQEAEEAEDVSRATFPGKTVLIVDDDIRNVFALSSRLETHGIHVLYAENGMMCMSMLGEHPEIDLVLMDVMMPEMDGYEAIRRIRANDRFEKLPIITVTAKAMAEDREKSIEAGASDYITKPVDADKLLTLLRIWLQAKA